MRGNLAQTIDALKREGVWVIGLGQGQDGLAPEKVDLSGPLAIVVGSEGRGLRRLVRESCDSIIELPMSGQIESFNAAAAGAIVLYMAFMKRGEQST
jgi:23S rRNA (guanosine2251-2'-O)-methyltransferase